MVGEKMAGGGRAARPGFGLLAVVVLLVGVSLMVALAVTPNLGQVQDQWRVDRSLDRLTRLTTSLDDRGTAIYRFEEDVRGFPKALSQLSSPVANTDPNLCDGTYGGQSGNWGGRYAGRIYPTTGTPLPIGLLRDTLEYADAGGAPEPAIVLVVTGVPEEQARHMDRREDDGDGATAGRVRYDGTPEAGLLTQAESDAGLVTLRWRSLISAC